MAHWITDGSSGFTVDGTLITFTSNDVGQIFNCMWAEDDDGVSSGQHYWKIHFKTLTGNGGIGLTSKDYFKKGWAYRGLSYRGNLSDGGGLLVQHFGPSINAGDRIGILASFEGDRLKVYLEINGKSLGLAFDIPASAFKSVFPVINFGRSGSATCQKETEIPSIMDRERLSFSGIEGDWKVIQIENGIFPESFNEADKFTPTTSLQKMTDNAYTWKVRIPSIYSTTITAHLSQVDQKWTATNVRSITDRGGSTRQDLGDKLDNLIKTVQLLEIHPDGSLSIKSETISSKWIRYDPTPGPYVADTFP